MLKWIGLQTPLFEESNVVSPAKAPSPKKVSRPKFPILSERQAFLLAQQEKKRKMRKMIRAPKVPSKYNNSAEADEMMRELKGRSKGHKDNQIIFTKNLSASKFSLKFELF